MLATQRVNEVYMNSREFYPEGPIIFFIRVYRVFHNRVTHWVSVAVSVSELVMWLASMDNFFRTSVIH